MSEFRFNIQLHDDLGNITSLPCNPGNAELYLFSNRWRDADHVWYIRGENHGSFVWRGILGVQFDEVANGMIESQAYNTYFKPAPQGVDLAQFLAYQAADIEFIPEDWN